MKKLTLILGTVVLYTATSFAAAKSAGKEASIDYAKKLREEAISAGQKGEAKGSLHMKSVIEYGDSNSVKARLGLDESEVLALSANLVKKPELANVIAAKLAIKDVAGLSGADSVLSGLLVVASESGGTKVLPDTMTRDGFKAEDLETLSSALKRQAEISTEAMVSWSAEQRDAYVKVGKATALNRNNGLTPEESLVRAIMSELKLSREEAMKKAQELRDCV